MNHGTRQAICAEIARILKEEREKRGFSMATVSEKAGLSYQMVSYVEREMRTPTIDTLLRIAGALDLDLAEVLQSAQRAVARTRSK